MQLTTFYRVLPNTSIQDACVRAKLVQSCPTLRDSMDYNPPGSSVYGILQARMLEWVAMPSSRGSSQSKDGTHVSSVSYTGGWVLYHWCHLVM